MPTISEHQLFHSFVLEDEQRELNSSLHQKFKKLAIAAVVCDRNEDHPSNTTTRIVLILVLMFTNFFR